MSISQIISYVLVGAIGAAAVLTLVMVVLLNFLNRRLDRNAAAHRFSTRPPPTRDMETVQKWLDS